VIRATVVAVLFLVGVNFHPLPQTAQHSVANDFSKVKFSQDEDVKCLLNGTETGDPDAGPSTIILKAPAKCMVPWHSHTAGEQLMIVRGEVLAEMEGMPAATLGPGGFASMPSRQKHQFSCGAKEECIMFVTFDRKYDIFWESPKK